MDAIFEAEGQTVYCAHCGRDIPTANYDLHSVHCQRNLERCSNCDEMVAKTRMEEHRDEAHALIPCSLCGLALERRLLSDHETLKCQFRLVHCEYCDLEKTAASFDEHVEVCGSRTDWCDYCEKWIKKSQRLAHDSSFHTDNPESRSLHNGNSESTSSSGEPPRASSVGPGRPVRLTQDAVALVVLSVVGVSVLIFHVFRRLRVPNRFSD